MFREDWRKQRAQNAIRELREGCDRCDVKIRGRERLRDALGALNLVVGLLCASLAGVSGIGTYGRLFDQAIVGGCALLAATLNAVLVFFNPASKRKKVKERICLFRALRNDAVAFLAVDSVDPHKMSRAPDVLRDFNRRMSMIDDKGVDPGPSIGNGVSRH